MAKRNRASGEQINLTQEMNEKLIAPVRSSEMGLDTAAGASGDAIRYEEFVKEHDPNGTHVFSAFTLATLQNGWGLSVLSSALPAYRKEIGGLVRLQGVCAGGATAAGTTIFALPPELTPSKVRALLTLSGTSFVRIDIMDNGAVVARTTAGSFICFDGLEFAL